MSTFKKALIFGLVLVSLLIITLQFSNKIASSVFKTREKAGLRVLSVPIGANVYVNGDSVGKTPYEDQDLTTQEYALKIETDSSSWEGKIKLIPGVLTVLNRELTPDSSSSAGEVLTLEKGKGVTIISNPSGALVEINGKQYGNTPISVDIAPGEHTFAIKKPSYLNRSIRATVPDGYNLVINADLALSEADLTKLTAPVITETPKVLVKNTPTGFLRVREKASVTSPELAKVSPGDELVLLEELSDWVRIRLSNGTEGYVSSTYVEKK